jgi:hypothetical protein
MLGWVLASANGGDEGVRSHETTRPAKGHTERSATRQPLSRSSTLPRQLKAWFGVTEAVLESEGDFRRGAEHAISWAPAPGVAACRLISIRGANRFVG